MEMLVTDTPIVINQYCDFLLPSVQIFSSPGVPQPLTGYSYLSQVRKQRNDPSGSPLGSLTVNVLDNLNGIVDVLMTNSSVVALFAAAIAANAAVLNPNAQMLTYWDLIGINSAGFKTRWLTGPCLLSFGVSH